MPSFHQNMNYFRLINMDGKIVYIEAQSLRDYISLKQKNSQYTLNISSSNFCFSKDFVVYFA